MSHEGGEYACFSSSRGVEKGYPCSECGKVEPCPSKLSRHIRRRHLSSSVVSRGQALEVDALPRRRAPRDDAECPPLCIGEYGHATPNRTDENTDAGRPLSLRPEAPQALGVEAMTTTTCSIPGTIFPGEHHACRHRPYDVVMTSRMIEQPHMYCVLQKCRSAGEKIYTVPSASWEILLFTRHSLVGSTVPV